MSDTEQKLLPCPFCGEHDIEVQRSGSPRVSCVVVCESCGATLESNEQGFGSAWNTRALEQSQQLISAAEDIGYREACESIGNGVSFLFNALSIDGDDYGEDTAEAESLSEALKRIARGLEPMGITPNDDDGDLHLPTKALEQSEWERVLIERLAVLHILSPEHETNPSKALHDIISYEVLISLDPLVSSDAVALIEKYGGTYPPAEVET